MLKGACHCGSVSWTFDGDPGEATACNCTICRRYGVLWIYDWVDEKVTLTGATSEYLWGDRDLGFHFCPTCGCVLAWRAAEPNDEGRTRIAVNVRMSEPETVAHLPVRHFDGLGPFSALPADGRTVHDMWF